MHSESRPLEKFRFVNYWKKAIMQRQYVTARHAHPWMIEFSSRLHSAIFEHILNSLTCNTPFGVKIRGRNKVEQIVEVVNKRKLQHLLSYCTDKEQTSLERHVPGKGRTCFH